MSNSKVLKRMWSEMKANFKDMLVKSKAEDKIPSQKDLEEYQSAVQDFVDIFDTIEAKDPHRIAMLKMEETIVADEAVAPTQADKNEPSNQSNRVRVRKDKPSPEEKECIWSIYTSNDRQFFTQHHAKEIGLTLHRRAATVLSILQSLIEADPDSHDSARRFTIEEDERILYRYTTDLADSYNSEGAIISDLSKEFGRGNHEIHSRLRYLKEHSPQKVRPQQCIRPYTAEEDKFVADLTLTPQDVSLIIGRGVHGIKKRRWALKKGTTDSAVVSEAPQPVAHTEGHLASERNTLGATLPVVEADKKAALWFEDRRFSSQPSILPDSTQSTSRSSQSECSTNPCNAVASSNVMDDLRGGNQRRKTAADFMWDPRFDPSVEQLQGHVGNTVPAPQLLLPVRAAPSRDIEVIVLSSPPRTSPSLLAPPPLSVPSYNANHNTASTRASAPTSTNIYNNYSHPASRTGWGKSSREVYCPPPPRFGTVFKSSTSSHAYLDPVVARSPPTQQHVSYSVLQAQATTRFLSDLEAEGMTVLQPRMTQDQVLAALMGYMLQCHGNSGTHAPDSNAIARKLFELTSSNGFEFMNEVMTTSYTSLRRVVTLLEHADCLCVHHVPPFNAGLQLADGMKSFTALCRRHDAYLQSRMGSDAPLLQALLWARDETEERRRCKMDVLVRNVMRRLAWD